MQSPTIVYLFKLEIYKLKKQLDQVTDPREEKELLAKLKQLNSYKLNKCGV